jgi:hypothetical protein
MEIVRTAFDLELRSEGLFASCQRADLGVASVSDDRPATGDSRDQGNRVDGHLLGLFGTPLGNDPGVFSSCESQILLVLRRNELVLCVHENEPIE